MSSLKHNDIVIPEDGTDPFVNCKLDRKKYADVLTDIVSGYADGFVLAINNPWGEGKTTFVKMWRQQLENNDFKTLYFNAWENDFQEEVIIALLSELEELREKSKKNFESLLQKSATFLKKVAPAAVKGAVGKAIGDEAVAEIAAAALEFTAEEVEEQIQSFNEKKKGIKDFRTALENFVKKVDGGKPVVFIIDELDRCRPSYAIQVLEQIKHLFSVSGIVFVLSIDKKQLGNAVRGAYGSDRIDADEYLRRFIDLEYIIPKPNIQMFIEYLYDYYAFDDFISSKKRSAYSNFNNDSDRLHTIPLLLFVNSGFSLRQLEKIFARIRVTLKSFSENQHVFPEILVLISYLEMINPLLLDKIRNSEISIQKLINELDDIVMPISDSTNIRKIRILVAGFMCKYANVYMTKSRKNEEGLINSESVSLENKLLVKTKLEDNEHHFTKAILNNQNHGERVDLDLNFILKKYDLTERIVN
ncbi:P-loop NTPase fold protein [Zobellia roscoffensis]|uniref:KAP family P-loop NTPase fold protein n=1 Tax=Zobellia roscoffensis TaxID=2779508 RepID=UPI00188B54E3|nr:P-loop NTPase fold protein [Zobellia roscoffensis]